MFTQNDIDQFEEKGISRETVESQIKRFKTGFPPMQLVSAAIPDNGILKFDDSEKERFIRNYESKSLHYRIVKFVPASGAASRMFKSLFSFINKFLGEKNQSLTDKEDVKIFFDNIEKFAFYPDLKNVIDKSGQSIDGLLNEEKYAEILEFLLTEKGLNYGQLPKGLLKFHVYSNGARRPVEEHLVEAANYTKDSEGNCYLHFTVSPEHLDSFRDVLSEKITHFEHSLNVKYEISYSTQKPETDTVAVDLNNDPFRERDGSLLFRPAGHGALLRNLNDIEADIIFIKNIDNVVPDRIKETTHTNKKLLGGVLIFVKDKIQELLDSSDEEGFIEKATEFLKGYMRLSFDDNFASEEKKILFLKRKLNRPVRVCGMVINTGEAGGGPFIAKNTDNTESLQIVESSQMDLNDRKQQSIVKESTHFNPVDIVCWTKDTNGNKFDLMKYIDPQTGFISSKSKDGRELKAMELPGLWNGSMADWNTVFVEVPEITFNPVKTVNDLLRENHQ